MSAAAFTLANSAPSIPLTVVAGVNDSFVFTGDGGLASTPETLPDSYTRCGTLSPAPIQS